MAHQEDHRLHRPRHRDRQIRDLEIYNRNNAPRQEFVGNASRAPYSDSPEDYVTYAEDDHFVNGPRRSPPIPWFAGQGIQRYDEDGHFIEPPPLAEHGMVSSDGRFGGYMPYHRQHDPHFALSNDLVDKVNWQKDGF